MTGTGSAPTFAYTTSVIEYSSAADMAAVNTLKRELTDVTTLRVASLTRGTVNLILGSSFTGLVRQAPQPGATAATSPAAQPSQPSSAASASASSSVGPSASASASGVTGLAQANGGITAAAACNADGAAFGGPLSR